MNLVSSVDRRTGASGALKQYVVFRVGGEEYGIPVGTVREVLLYPEVTHLPRMPDFLEGIVRIRGHVVPIIDLRARFGAPIEAHEGRRVIVVAAENHIVGFVVDAVEEVRSISTAGIRPLPPEVPRAGREFLAGVAPGGGERLLLILDLNRLLTLEERGTLVGGIAGAPGT